MADALPAVRRTFTATTPEGRLATVLRAQRDARSALADRALAARLLAACGGDEPLALRYAQVAADPEVVATCVWLGVGPDQLDRHVTVGELVVRVGDLAARLEDDQLRAVLAVAAEPGVCTVCGAWGWEEEAAGWTCQGCGAKVPRVP